MSAYLTHLSFGIKNYQCMDDGLVRKCIKSNRHAYFYGLSGPDFFFYDLPNCIHGRKKAGSLLHDEKSGAFIENMFLALKDYSGKEKEIGIAYLAGFICHYEIDSQTHPEIYEQIGEEPDLKGSGRHYELEAAYDVYASVAILGKLPSRLKQNRIMRLNKAQKRVITNLYQEAFFQTYHEYRLTKFSMGIAYACATLAITCLRDPYGISEKILCRIEKCIFGYPVLSPLFCNDNTYDVTVEDWERYRINCEKGLIETLSVMDYYEEWLVWESAESFRKLNEAIGDKSYHFGSRKRQRKQER